MRSMDFIYPNRYSSWFIIIEVVVEDFLQSHRWVWWTCNPRYLTPIVQTTICGLVLGVNSSCGNKIETNHEALKIVLVWTCIEWFLESAWCVGWVFDWLYTIVGGYLKNKITYVDYLGILILALISYLSLLNIWIFQTRSNLMGKIGEECQPKASVYNFCKIWRTFHSRLGLVVV
jgi:hypothetical protein